MVTFNELWKNHPTNTDNENPCSANGKSNFGDQCAIRLGVCLQNGGIDTTRIPGVTRCWYHNIIEGHIIRAEEFAKALKQHSPFLSGIQRIQEVNPIDFKNTIAGKRGIIFYKDYWRRTVNGKKECFRNRSGDHIDLWNGARLTDWRTWARIQLNLSWEGSWSDYEKSKEIWFWRVV